MWGFSTHIDLQGCEPSLITSEEHIRNFSIQLVKLIEMKAYGEPLIVNFGSCKEVEGFTLVQLIETSSITGHFANATNRAFIDIFSCKKYSQWNAAKFCREYFGATKINMHFLERD